MLTMIFTAAFKEEATEFIKQLNLQKKFDIIDGLFTNNTFFLLITGKGISNAKQKFGHFIKLYEKPIKFVYNFGICGKLSENILLNKIYKVNKVVSLNKKEYILNENYANKYYTTCITTNQPVQNIQIANYLKMHADIVDMELWEIARICSLEGINLKSFKYVSDDAREMISTSDIRRKMPLISREIFNYYKKNYYQNDLV